jgi:spore maturation protein CgeB
VLNANLARTVFYDMDTPVTLSRLEQGESVPYLPEEGLGGFDLVLSYTGGKALQLLRRNLGAKRAATLYGWVDPAVYHRVSPRPEFEADLSYLGTYSADRQPALDMLLMNAARRMENRRFVIGGAMYPAPQQWPANVRHYDHVAPPEHAAFYSSSPLTLNITRGCMAAMGYCPSGRLFEAAACGTAVLSDWWEGLETFFQPEEEILIATDTADTITSLARSADALKSVGQRARERALDCHTAEIRARRLAELIETPCDESERQAAYLSVGKGAS